MTCVSLSGFTSHQSPVISDQWPVDLVNDHVSMSKRCKRWKVPVNIPAWFQDFCNIMILIYPLVNIDPENHPFLVVETNLPTPICQGLCQFTGGYNVNCGFTIPDSENWTGFPPKLWSLTIGIGSPYQNPGVWWSSFDLIWTSNLWILWIHVDTFNVLAKRPSQDAAAESGS